MIHNGMSRKPVKILGATCIGVDFDLRGQEQDINEQGYRRKGLSLYKT